MNIFANLGIGDYRHGLARKRIDSTNVFTTHPLSLGGINQDLYYANSYGLEDINEKEANKIISMFNEDAELRRFDVISSFYLYVNQDTLAETPYPDQSRVYIANTE